MASSGKKEYTLKINGLAKNITDVTKLEEVLAKLDTTIGKANQTTATSTQTTRQRSSALTEEEKAEKKLLETIDRAVRARTDANRAQIEANLAAREAQREVTREIQVRNTAEGSIRQMGMQLTDMRNRYENLTRAQREDINVGGELLRQIQALDKEYKNLRESTGNFRDSVGNYEKATSGLGKLNESIGNVSSTSLGFAQNLMQTNQLMGLFGDNSEENTERTKNLQKVMLALTVVQGLSNTLLKENNGISIASIALSKVHTAQVYARAIAISLATKNTLAATIAQKAFNLVAAANPYVLLAMALAAVVLALADFSSGADTATDSGERYKSVVNGVTFATKEARDAHDGLIRKIRDIQIEIDLANGKLTEYQANLLKLTNSRTDAYQDALGKYNDAIAESNKLLEDDFNSWAVTFNGFTGAWEKAVDKSNKRAKEAKKQLNNDLDRIDVEYQKNQEKQNTQHNAAINKQNEDNRIANLTGLNQSLAQIDRARKEELTKAKKDNETAIAQNKKLPKEQQIVLADLEAINSKYDKQRDAAEKDANKKAADASKAAQDRRKADLEKQKATLEKERDLIRKAEDDKTSLVVNEFERRRAEVDAKYARQREDLQRQIDTDTNLTEKGREAIRAVIANIDAHISADRKKIREDELKAEKEAEAKRKELLDKRIADADRRNSLLLSGLDIALEQAQQKIGEVVSRNKGGLELINVEATRANLAASNKALDEYIAGIKKAQEALKASHEATIKDLKEGTPEYEEELQKYTAANIQLNANLVDANKQREANTKASNDVLTDYYSDLFKKIGKYAEAASMAVSSVMDTFNMGLEMQIESLNEQLESLTERYEEVKELREESTERVEELEQRLRDATGGTAEALKEQLQDEMHNKAELEREEARLQKEKEKREAEIAKKEKQVKRNNLISNIAQSIANTAMAVVQALAAVPPPFNFALAALVGAMGAVQTGIMTKQLTKLEDGGLINGPSHANGGARIQGTNIEVEGGEYVVNKESTAANSRLIDFINNTRSTITAADLVGVVPGDTNTPVIINNQTGGLDYEALADAMANIHIEPKVAVTDIMDAEDTVVNVRDLAGY